MLAGKVSVAPWRPIIKGSVSLLSVDRCEGRRGYNYSVPAGLRIAGAFTRTVAGAVGVAGA